MFKESRVDELHSLIVSVKVKTIFSGLSLAIIIFFIIFMRRLFNRSFEEEERLQRSLAVRLSHCSTHSTAMGLRNQEKFCSNFYIKIAKEWNLIQ